MLIQKQIKIQKRNVEEHFCIPCLNTYKTPESWLLLGEGKW
jgi:hypothetical protein